MSGKGGLTKGGSTVSNTNTGGKGGKTSVGIGSVENLKIGNMLVALKVTAVIVTQF